MSKKKLANTKDKSIYIVLTQTRTYPARLIRFYTKEPYAHASIAFDEELEEMYSFARKGKRNPFRAGFIREDITSGVFGSCTETNCSIYRLKVTQIQYQRVREELEIFKQNKEKYSYNFLGIVGVMMNIPIQSEHRYFCSQFVAYLLEQSGIRLSHKNCALVRPVDIRMSPQLKRIYSGTLVDYRRTHTLATG